VLGPKRSSFEVFEVSHLANGRHLDLLKSELADHFQKKNVVLVASNFLALFLVLSASGIVGEDIT
jgi:dTDP-4-amino-4,6-dideoxygalactose transaminase